MSTSDCTILCRRAGRGFSKREVRSRFERIVAAVAGEMSITCLLTDDRELRRLNREFLGKDYPTDVLSFPEERPGSESGGSGELAISVERAMQQAVEYGHPVEDEIGILMLHGILHLIGLDHERDRGRMARLECGWRKKLGLPVGLIERTNT